MHSPILLHANSNTTSNYSETQNDIICRLIYTLGDVGVQVYGVSFDGDKVSVKTICKEFYTGVASKLDSQRTPDLFTYYITIKVFSRAVILHIFLKEWGLICWRTTV